MKQLSTTLLLIACVLFSFSCTSKTKTSTCTETKTDTIFGLVGDGTSMNTLEVYSIPANDTVWFVIDDSTDVKDANLLIGNLVEVVYNDTKENKVATKIVGDATYADAIGDWTMADPIAKDKVMGVSLQVNGVASSINMATLVYKSWELSGEKDMIILKGESIGTGETFNFTDTAKISKDDKTLTLLGVNVVYTKQ